MIKIPRFGDILLYRSPVDGHKTPCVYIRDDNGKAVIIFAHAEWVARVNYKTLEWTKEILNANNE